MNRLVAAAARATQGRLIGSAAAFDSVLERRVGD
jgi:hypothetical protein